MSYTARSCAKAGEVNMRVCLKSPFATQHVYLPQHGWNVGQVKMTGVDPINSTLAGYINYINDGSDSSLFTDLADPDQAQWGGYYTGAKFMAVALNGGDYSVGVVAHAVTDADDTTAPSMTVTNVGDGGTAPPGSFTSSDGPTDVHLAGPSEAGGDEISWFEGRSTTVHFLTSDGSTITRQQAFPLDGSEQFRDFAMGRVASWIYDGSDFWHISYRRSSSPRVLLTRFKPTTVGDPYDYTKYELTFDDPDMDALVLAGIGPFFSCTTANSFFLQAADLTSFGNIKWLEIAKDGTSYTEYFFTGNDVTTDFAENNVPFLARNPSGTLRLTGTAYTGDGYPVGTYDLTCGGGRKQGHVYTQIIRTPPESGSGNLIPSGDMQAGDDVFSPSGNANDGGDHLLWRGGN